MTRTLKNEKPPRRKDVPLKDPLAVTPAVPWHQRTLVLAVASSLLLWAAFPPLNLWPLAWLAPLPWLLLIRQSALPGWKSYLKIWLAGFLHWLLMLQGVRLAHPALYGGWVALAAYLAVYLVLFISISRVAVHRLRWPLVVAAPVVWIGLEFLRANLISGFACGLLAHTQTAWPSLLQIADLGGAYAVSFLMMLVTATISHYLPLTADSSKKTPACFAPLAVTVCLLIATLAYGRFRLNEPLPKDIRPPLKVALIQGSLDTRFDQPFDERVATTFGHYDPLTQQAISNEPQLDLIVWPESMFAIPEFTEFRGSRQPQSNVPPHVRERLIEIRKPFQHTLTGLQERMRGSAFLFGATTLAYDLSQPKSYPDRNYNAALLYHSNGQLAGRYYKMHPVMFGEFIPLADLFPFLYNVTPMASGMSIGERPVVMPVAHYNLAPNICFESTVPHLIREQVSSLQQGDPAAIDAIVNVSNDGWFWGSSILDLHFRCSVFRAIENRKPVIIAANTGISAHLDGCGRILQHGPKRAPQVLIASVVPDGRPSPYHRLGDGGAWLCAAATWIVALIATWRR